MHFWQGANAAERIESELRILKMIARSLAAPRWRTYTNVVRTWDMPPGGKRMFNRLASSIPGAAWHVVQSEWVIPCAVLRMLDPDRANTAWRTLPNDHPFGEP